MTYTNDDAARLLTNAGIPLRASDNPLLLVSRVQLCRALMTLCHNEKARVLSLDWDTPLFESLYPANYCGLRDVDEDIEMMLDEFGLPYQFDHGITTFGDLYFYVESRVRELWSAGNAPNCASQSLFYDLRRIAGNSGVQLGRLHPRTPLEQCLPAHADADLADRLCRRYGVAELPISLRVAGAMEPEATWLVLWIAALICGFIVLDDTRAPLWFLVYFVLSAVAIAWLISCISRPVWISVHTLGDLTHWLLRANNDATNRLRVTVETL